VRAVVELRKDGNEPAATHKKRLTDLQKTTAKLRR